MNGKDPVNLVEGFEFGRRISSTFYRQMLLHLIGNIGEVEFVNSDKIKVLEKDN